jgi:hypothetical protein
VVVCIFGFDVGYSKFRNRNNNMKITHILSYIIIAFSTIACTNDVDENVFYLSSHWTPEESSEIRRAALEWDIASQGMFHIDIMDYDSSIEKDSWNWIGYKESKCIKGYSGLYYPATSRSDGAEIYLCEDHPNETGWIFKLMLHEIGHHMRRFGKVEHEECNGQNVMCRYNQGQPTILSDADLMIYTK